MERLLVLRLESSGIEAEAVFNGVPLLRVGGMRTVAQVPVHEYTLAGPNELQLVLRPAAPGAPTAEPEPLLADGHTWASARLLLPRVGGVADPASARTLAQLDWAPAADTVLHTPHTETVQAELPINFPRWRWLDAPVVPEPEALKKELAVWLLDIAVGLARGNPEPLLQATRLRLEDLATAYQRNLADEVGRLRVHVQQLHAQQPLKPLLPAAGTLRLRTLAGGRLIECLAPDGGAALQSPVAGGGRASWPLRVARIDGRFYGVR